MLENILKPDKRMQLVAIILILAMVVLTVAVAISNRNAQSREITNFSLTQEESKVNVLVEQPATREQIKSLQEDLQGKYPNSEINIEVDYNFSTEKADSIQQGLSDLQPGNTEGGEGSDNTEKPTNLHGAYDQ